MVGLLGGWLMSFGEAIFEGKFQSMKGFVFDSDLFDRYPKAS